MRTSSRALSVVGLLVGLTGCFSTVGTPPGDPVRGVAPRFTRLRIVILGRVPDEPAGLAARLERAAEDALPLRVVVERLDVSRPGVRPTGGPTDPGAMADEVTALVQASRPAPCASEALGSLALSVGTLGLVPYLECDAMLWHTEVYDDRVVLRRTFDFRVERRRYGWLPLVPLVPFNAAWRALRGGTFEYFLRAYPRRLGQELRRVTPTPPGHLS